MAPLAASSCAPIDARRSRLDRLIDSIDRAAHYLPAQGPLTSFVHHNTLHAFEHLEFEQAVVAGGELYGCHPFLLEEDYRERMARGRITRDDIEAVLIDDLGDAGDKLLGFLGTRFNLRRHMLDHPLRTGTATELRWVMAETDALRQFREEARPEITAATIAGTRRWVLENLRPEGRAESADWRARGYVERLLPQFGGSPGANWGDAVWESFTLHLLWTICLEGVGHSEPNSVGRGSYERHRDLLLAHTGRDSDELVDSLLIRFTAAYLDQGFAHWALPPAEGFWDAFAQLARQRFAPRDRWLWGLRDELADLEQRGLSPIEVVAESLDELGLADDEVEPYLLATLLALRGYAGMIWQLETRPDRAVRSVTRGTLVEYLAVRLLLERHALRHIASETTGFELSLAELRPALRQRGRRGSGHREQRAFLVFQLAQLEGWSPRSLYRLRPEEWRRVVREIEAFSALERRRIYHLAFERRYRRAALDALAVHGRQLRFSERHDQPWRPQFQIVCCLDDREESFRRHLEEVAPHCETFGAAGFFSVAMSYRGVDHAHFTPLCPVAIKPRHLVAEKVDAPHAATDLRRRRRRRTFGSVTRKAYLGSRTFAGGWIAGVLGSLATLPLVMRVFFPRAAARAAKWLGRMVEPPPHTRLELRADQPDAEPTQPQAGFRPHEMAAIVERLLRDIGLTARFSRLVLMCGHGSSSLNNPHQSAYACGACGGNPGGPNARAFAQMANDPEVRRLLEGRGLSIPDDTRFVGAYHNTCDDSVTFHDLDLLPPGHGAEMEEVTRAIDEARMRNAHERCRRFESADLTWPPERALEHCEGRSQDLSQARPECGHATNALLLIGRREWSRGLFMDRRAFLQSYDPAQDDQQHSVLEGILQAVIPVCAGINLEYYFSYVDPAGYGSGTKLPHNIVSLLGVMNGAASDLRTGLPWQMVEIHEPMRLLMVVEASPETLGPLLAANPEIDRVVKGGWLRVATFDPETLDIKLFHQGKFQTYRPATDTLPSAASSQAWYSGQRDHLGFARIAADSATTEGAR